MYNDFQAFLQKEIAGIREAGLYKNERIIASPQGGEITLLLSKVLTSSSMLLPLHS